MLSVIINVFLLTLFAFVITPNIINIYEAKYLNLLEKLKTVSPINLIDQRIDKVKQMNNYLDLMLNHFIFLK